MGNKLILIAGITCFLFLAIIVSAHNFKYYETNFESRMQVVKLIAKSIGESINVRMLEGEVHQLDSIVRSIGNLENIKEAQIIDANGIIRYSHNSLNIETQTTSKMVLNTLKTQQESEGLEDFGNEHILSVTMPFINKSLCQACHGKQKIIIGVLRVGMDWQPMKSALASQLLKNIIVSVIFYIIILVLFLLFHRLYNNAQKAYLHLHQVHEQLIKSEKMAAVGQMAAAISHDLRNPLTGIKMATYYLSSKLNNKEEEIDNILKDIELEIEYASNVVTNILAYSRPTDLIYTRSDINKIIEDTMHYVSLQNKDSSIKVIKDYDFSIPEILIDNKYIKQAIVNVLTNSLQAMPKGGDLTVATKLLGGSVLITIKDTGVGIAKSDLGNVFAPFFTKKARGVGLGLSIVNNIITKHGGMTQLDSEEGRGTIVSIYLPMHNAENNDDQKIG
ncbi:MAG: hypothetical protein HY810_05735 [Candidatus Omnitrophica bacterium]|nr:hypothetical protein [Candidatus Omnitrophota bacterium]